MFAGLVSPCGGGEERRAGSLRGGWHRPEAHAVEPRVFQPARDLRVREAEPHVPHPLLVLVAIVLEHVDHEDAAAGAEHASGLAQHGQRVGRVVQHETDRRGVERRPLDRQGIELALPELDVADGRETLPRRGPLGESLCTVAGRRPGSASSPHARDRLHLPASPQRGYGHLAPS